MNTDSATASSVASSRITTIVVEDDVSVGPLLAEWIQETDGFILRGQFPDAESALSAILQYKPNIVLTDINLPGLSGIELVREAKSKLRNTQFVMLTIYEDSNHIFEALAAGATGYLSKRTPREALISALREVHAGGSPMSSSIARKVVQSFQRKTAKAEPIEQLSKRENEVLELLAQGLTAMAIASRLAVSPRTVHRHLDNAYRKLGVHDRMLAVGAARRHGLISVPTVASSRSSV